MLKPKRRWHLLVGLISVLFLTTACFRSVGDESQLTVVAERVTETPTFTPTNTLIPTNSPTPLDAVALAADRPTDEASETPTETPTDTPTNTPTETPTSTETPVSVAQALVTNTPDDFQLTATELVRTATEGAGIPLTQTAIFLQGPSSTPTNTATATTNPFIPSNTPVSGGVSVPQVSGADCVHEVRAGERLFLLKRYYGISVTEIAARNGIVNPDLLSIGQRLVIPGCGTTGNLPPFTSTPRPGGDDVIINPPPSTSTCGATYIVQEDDTLFRIALRCNVSVAALQTANRIVNPDLIYMGDTLQIP